MKVASGALPVVDDVVEAHFVDRLCRCQGSEAQCQKVVG